MKILILSQWFPPEPIILVKQLAETFQKLGHRVIVLTGFPNYPTGVLYQGYRIRLWHKECIDGISVVRVPLFIDHSRSGWKRMLNYLSFGFFAALLGGILIKRHEVIFAYHPPLTIGLPALVLRRLWGVPFVLQIQDMWPETLHATGMMKNKFLLRIVYIFAQYIYKKAGAICVISNGFRKNLEKKGIPPDKIFVIYNWVDLQNCYQEEPDIGLKKHLKIENKFIVMFAGNIGEAQALDTVIDAAEILRAFDDICFIFVGDGVGVDGLRIKCQSMKLTNVVFLGSVSSEDMPRYYSIADILLVHLKDDPLFSITIPSKIYSYMGSGKPVLAALSGEAAERIINCGAGLACRPQNPHEMAELVKRMYAMPPAERIKMGINGRNSVIDENNREKQIGKIEKVLYSVCRY